MLSRKILVICLVLILLCFNMVNGAEAESSKAQSDTFLNIGKSFSHCSKLIKSNYTIWFAGILSTCMGLIHIPKIRMVAVMLEYFKANAAKKLDELEDFFLSNYGVNAAEYKQANTALFQILYSLIDPTLSAIREAGASALFGNGFGLLKRISDKFGPGVGAKQTETKVKIMYETQNADENAEEFADRLEQLNASLEAPIEDTMLVQFFINGISDADLKKFLVDKQLDDDSQSFDFDSVKRKVNQYTIRHGMVNKSVDGMRAEFSPGKGAKGGKGRGGFRGGYGSRGRGGRGYQSANDKVCDFCERPGHFWRQCRILNKDQRFENTSAENHKSLDVVKFKIWEGLSDIDKTKFSTSTSPAMGALSAELEFPGMDGRLANVQQVAGNISPYSAVNDTINSTFKYVQKVILLMMAAVFSLGSFALFLGLLMQMLPAHAMSIPNAPQSVGFLLPQIKLPDFIDLSGPPSLTSADAKVANVSSLGLHWDSCAGHVLLNTTKPFIAWDRNAVKYRINGAVGATTTQGTGRALFVFGTYPSDYEVIPSPSVYSPALKEPLIGAVHFGEKLNVSTFIGSHGSFVTLPSGRQISLDTSTGVTRSSLINLFDPSIHDRVDVKSFLIDNDASSRSYIPNIMAKAANLIEGSRFVTGTTDREEESFRSWTRRLCGLSPEALSHAAENALGCDCPPSIPKKYKDLRWWPSAIAGKSRSSSHPSKPFKEATRFRELVGMDFLEFEVNGKKFHGQGFICCFSTHGAMYCTPKRSDAAAGLLKYLNATEQYVSSGATLVRLKHDRAKEFLSEKFKSVCVYSLVVSFATVPYNHPQNSEIERFNQTIQRMVTTVMHDSNLPEMCTVYIIDLCVTVYNFVPVRSLNWKSRHEVATGQKPDLRYIFRGGALCRVLKPIEIRQHTFDCLTDDSYSRWYESKFRYTFD